MAKLSKHFTRLIGQQRHEYKRRGINYYTCETCGNELYIPLYSEWEYRLKEFKGCKSL